MYFFVSNLRVLLLPCIFTRAGATTTRRRTTTTHARLSRAPADTPHLSLLSPIRAILAMMQKQPKERPVYAGCRVHSFCGVLETVGVEVSDENDGAVPRVAKSFPRYRREVKVDEQCEKVVRSSWSVRVR